MQTTFVYEAAALSGRVETGALDAETANDARSLLAMRGLYVISLVVDGSRRGRREAISARDLAVGLRILGDLLESGLPLGRALHAFAELAPRGWRRGLPSIRQSVREGQGLAAALRDAPVEVPPLVIGIVQAGEAGSGLAAAVRRGADLTEAGAETQAAVRAALAYPAVVGFAGLLAVTVLMTVVLPRFAQILGDLGQTLPASTRIVIGAASVGRVLVIPAIGVVGTGTIVWRKWIASPDGRRQWHRALLGVPLVGSVRRSFAVARFNHSLSALLDSGVGMTAALELAGCAAADAELEARVLDARQRVSAGQSLSHALDACDAATPTAVQLTRAGEESGRLGGMLSHAARIEQQRADRTVQAAVRMLEPALLLTFASVVALIAAALLQAIYSVHPA